jgi:hypothetical protein
VVSIGNALERRRILDGQIIRMCSFIARAEPVEYGTISKIFAQTLELI